MKKLMMAAMVAAIGLSAAAAYTPSFAYQGVLRDEYGDPLAKTDSAKITFKIYKSSSGTDFLWSKVYTVSLATNGLFNVELAGAGTNSDGTSTTLDKVAADNSNEDLYIGLMVEGSTGEISPRQKLVPAPRAIFAHDVKTAQGDLTVKGDLTVAGAISMSDGSNTLSVANIWATGTLYSNDKATFKNGAQVEGAMTVSESATIGGSAQINGDAEIAGKLAVGKAPLTVAGVEMSMPIGAIIMWAGTKDNIPDGWQLCDGSAWKGDASAYIGPDSLTMKVPDLRGRFIVGTVGDGSTSVTVEGESVSYATGNTGGKNNVALTTEQLPSHSHGINSRGYLVDNQKDYYLYGFGWDKGKDNHDPQSDGSSYPQEKSKTYNTTSTGSGQAHENRPPFYALCYIIKVK